MAEQITQDELLELLSYDSGTGRLTWKARDTGGNFNKLFAGKTAGGLNRANGYICISIKNRTYLAHRIIYMMEMGEWPEYIDHIDGNKDNNSWLNLRSVAPIENCWNKHNVKGVSYQKSRGKWLATIMKEGKSTFLGRFSKMEDALKARRLAEIDVFKEFAPNR